MNQGLDFATLAEEKSEDTGTKENGGLYQFAPEMGMTDPEFAKAAQALAVGEYTSDPVRSQFGYHIIKLENIIPAQEKPFEEVQQLIVERLTHEAQIQYFQEYMDNAREKAQVTKEIGE